MTSAVEVESLVKTYPAPGGGTFNAVNGVSFEVRKGEIFGFLGPNGAGKTTTLEIIEGIREPTSGRTAALGLDSRRDREELKKRIGVQLQAGSYFPFLTLEEILRLFGSFYPRRRDPLELLERVALSDKRHAQVKHLSGGQARRFSVVAALVNDPEVVFLDEPTTGLDPQARRTVWELIRSINRDEGKTVVLTTHLMEEAEVLADRVAILDHGEIQALDTPRALVERHAGTGRVRFAVQEALDAGALRWASAGASPDDLIVQKDGPGGHLVLYDVPATDPRATLSGLLRLVEERGIELRTIEVAPGSLEDVFLALTGHQLRD